MSTSRRTRNTWLASVLLACTIALTALVATGAAQKTTAVEPITSMTWLKDHLNDPGVVLIATDDDPPPYASGHIPTARFLGHDATLDHKDHRLKPPAELATVLARAGASDNSSRIVIYGGPLQVGWLYYAFASVGHADRVSVLDGNYSAWLAAGFPSASDTPAPGKGSLTVRPAPDFVVDRAWVRNHLNDASTKLLDVRSTREWARGMIPNATKFSFGDLYTDIHTRRFKSPRDMAAAFEQAGVAKGQTVVTYCAIGMRASLAYFAARAAGIPARVYVGSWEDWTSDPASPIAKPPQ
jgi:thiosulfate/3-mercaptopyruvate sulfurtransferase